MKSRYYKTEGIILKAVKFGEGHKILITYTKDLGKIEMSAFGARKPKSKLANKVQVFNYARFFLYHSKENEPSSIKDIEILNYFDEIKGNYTKYIAATSLVEPILKFVGKYEKDSSIFNFLLESFKKLNSIPDNKIVYLLLMYKIKLHSILGYDINLDVCSVCNNKLDGNIYVDSFKGFPLCENCKANSSLKLEIGTIKFIKWSQINKIDRVSKVTMGENTLGNLKNVLQKIDEYLFNNTPDIWRYFDSLKNSG